MEDKFKNLPITYCRKQKFVLLYINSKKTKKRTTQIKVKLTESLAFC